MAVIVLDNTRGWGGGGTDKQSRRVGIFYGRRRNTLLLPLSHRRTYRPLHNSCPRETLYADSPLPLSCLARRDRRARARARARAYHTRLDRERERNYSKRGLRS